MTTWEISKKLWRAFGAISMRPIEFAKYCLPFGDSGRQGHVAKRYGLGEGLPTVDLLDLFGSFDECVRPYAYLEGGSTTIDLALLRAFARRYDGCRYLEIGGWRGESVANVAAVARECISLSLSEEEMRKQGWGEAYLATARHYSARLENVIHLGHDSKTFDFSPYYGKCDLVFIDGDHSYDGVRSDTENAFRLLRNDRSVIVWHDYRRTPESDIHWELFAAMLDGAPREAVRQFYHVSNTLCAIYIKEWLPINATAFPAMPNKEFEVHIRVRRY